MCDFLGDFLMLRGSLSSKAKVFNTTRRLFQELLLTSIVQYCNPQGEVIY